MENILFTEKVKKIDSDIYSVLNDHEGAAYDNKAMMYEKLVSSNIYNKIIWGTSPDDYKQFAQEAINDSSGPLLDAGCGGLIQTQDIYRQTKRQCFLIDNSSEMLKIAKGRLIANTGELNLNIKLLQADAFKLPFSDHVFDTVCSFGMIHVFDKKQEYIQELLRVLKPRGRFYFSTMTTKRVISKWYMQQLKKMNEFGELFSENQTLSLFDEKTSPINSYMKGSMLFIKGYKNR